MNPTEDSLRQWKGEKKQGRPKLKKVNYLKGKVLYYYLRK